MEIFFQDIENPYTIIGELKMAFSPELSNEEMVNRMKEVSKGIGVDAIIGIKREVIEIAIPRVFLNLSEEKPDINHWRFPVLKQRGRRFS